MNKELTPKQQIVFDKIKLYIKNYKRSPSIRNLCFLCDVNSPATIYVHLKNLKEKGYIDYTKGEHRSIVVIEDEGGNNVQVNDNN